MALELVSNFYYFDSYISYDESCEKDAQFAHWKKSSNSFWENAKTKLWKNNNVSFHVKMRLYESVILSILLYSAQLWPLTATLLKRLDAPHHRRQRSISCLLAKQGNELNLQL